MTIVISAGWGWAFLVTMALPSIVCIGFIFAGILGLYNFWRCRSHDRVASFLRTRSLKKRRARTGAKTYR